MIHTRLIGESKQEPSERETSASPGGSDSSASDSPEPDAKKWERVWKGMEAEESAASENLLQGRLERRLENQRQDFPGVVAEMRPSLWKQQEHIESILDVHFSNPKLPQEAILRLIMKSNVPFEAQACKAEEE